MAKKVKLSQKQSVFGYGVLLGGWRLGLDSLLTIKRWPKLLLGLGGLYFASTALLAGFATQNAFLSLKQSFGLVADNIANEIYMLPNLYIQTALGATRPEADQIQNFWGGLLLFIFWLVILWAVSRLFDNKKVSIKDALYQGPASIIPLFLLILMTAVQALPAVIGVFLLSVALLSGLASQIILVVIFGVLSACLIWASMYLLSSSILALTLVAPSGTGPIVALKKARDLVKKRRIMVWANIFWLGVWLVIVSATALLPPLLIDSLLPVDSIPLVPIVAQLLYAFYPLFVAIFMFKIQQELQALAKKD